MKSATGPTPTWLKSTATLAGVMLVVPGMFLMIGYLCFTPLAVTSGDRDALGVGLVSFTLMTVTLGAGGILLWHGFRSSQGKPSALLRLPPAWLMSAIFGLFVTVGFFVYQNNLAAGFFFPPILFIAAALPPLLAVAWFMQQRVEGLTWRRGSVAFVGGATVGVAIAVTLEILLPVIVLALVLGLGDVVSRNVGRLLDALAGRNIAAALTNPGFIYVFLQLAVIAPLAEEFAKPLVTLPLIGRLSRREAFLVAAMAGAGFAALENVLYAEFGSYFWAGILLVRALGGAIHPLGAGLVGLGWRDVLNGEPNAWRNALGRFGLAAGMHAIWNGGSLLLITLAGAQFFGKLPPEINVLGFSAAGTTLALLIVLGLAALWLGRAIVQRTGPVVTEVEHLRLRAVQVSAEIQFAISDRAVAIWALACLAAIVPAGITGLRLLVR
jgi:RsiW-degrading membrane proteinase PrsW (M82 family)